MTARKAAAAVLVALGAAVAGCGSSCPSEPAATDPTAQDSLLCNGSAGQVDVALALCAACSGSAPSCVPDLTNLAAANQIFLDTSWSVCSGSSCGSRSCQQVHCAIAVGAGTYTVLTNAASAGTNAFTLGVESSTSTCAWQP